MSPDYPPEPTVVGISEDAGRVAPGEPSGAADLHPRPTGEEIFDSLSADEQDEMLGAEAAQQVRDGDASLADFVKEEGGFIVQRPVSDL